MRYLDEAEEAICRAWPVGGTVDHRELHGAVRLVIAHLKEGKDERAIISIFGDWYVAPTTEGEIRWRNEDWGVVLDERTYEDGRRRIIRLPWSVFSEIAQTAHRDAKEAS